MEPPIYKHDCEQCTFLGTFDKADLYYCCSDRTMTPFGTVIARHSSAPSDYTSGISVARSVGDPTHAHPELRQLRVAYLIARDRGLTT